MSTWKPVLDIPEENQEVIVTIRKPGGKTATLFCIYNRGKYICPPSILDVTDITTHWMPMPEPYKFK